MEASAVPHPASLLVTDPSGHRVRVELEPVPFRIGRHADNNLVIRDSRASRNHARGSAARQAMNCAVLKRSL